MYHVTYNAVQFNGIPQHMGMFSNIFRNGINPFRKSRRDRNDRTVSTNSQTQCQPPTVRRSRSGHCARYVNRDVMQHPGHPGDFIDPSCSRESNFSPRGGSTANQTVINTTQYNSSINETQNSSAQNYPTHIQNDSPNPPTRIPQPYSQHNTPRETPRDVYAQQQAGRSAPTPSAPSSPLDRKAVKSKNLSPPVIACRDASESCTVCLEDFAVGDKVIWLPCLHKFHAQDCGDWVTENQSCPICKLDLHPTHSHRKLRFRLDEVEQMSVKELRYICYYVGIMDKLEGAFEKKDVVQVIMASRLVTVVCPPRLDLMEMPVRSLRHIMEQLNISTAGCLDKNDLVNQLLKQPFVAAESN